MPIHTLYETYLKRSRNSASTINSGAALIIFSKVFETVRVKQLKKRGKKTKTKYLLSSIQLNYNGNSEIMTLK